MICLVGIGKLKKWMINLEKKINGNGAIWLNGRDLTRIFIDVSYGFELMNENW